MTEPVAWMYQEGNGKPFASINPPSSFDPNELSENEVSVTRLYPESVLTAEREARVKAEAALAMAIMDAEKIRRMATVAYEKEWAKKNQNGGPGYGFKDIGSQYFIDAALSLAAEKGADHE